MGVMYTQLKRNRLEVRLDPAENATHHGHKVRTVQNENPWWYKELCLRHTVSRKNKRKRNGKKHHDTKIRRQHILSALRKLADGSECRSLYSEELVELAHEVEEEWRTEEHS